MIVDVDISINDGWMLVFRGIIRALPTTILLKNANNSRCIKILLLLLAKPTSSAKVVQDYESSFLKLLNTCIGTIITIIFVIINIY